MPFGDLREFLSYLETKGELVRIRKQVDVMFEIAAYIRKTSDIQGPALLFENVKGSAMPVVGGLFATTQRLLLALGVSSQQQAARMLIESMENPIASIVVPNGSCKEVIYRGGDVDLGKLPVPTYSSKDGGPFLTMGVAISRDPETNARNLGIYRFQVKGKRRLGGKCSAFDSSVSPGRDKKPGFAGSNRIGDKSRAPHRKRVARSLRGG